GGRAHDAPLRRAGHAEARVGQGGLAMILERFKVPEKDQVLVSEAALRRTVTQIFEKLGLTPEDAAEGADVLTMTALRGVEMQAAQQDMVGVCFTGAGLSVVPTFASKPMLGTNPIALAAPARHEAPMLFDAATSAIAGNKIRLAIRIGSPLLPSWVTDKDGTPIMEEKPVFDRDDFFQAPLGGTREQGSHKGYGFALMAEVLS